MEDFVKTRPPTPAFRKSGGLKLRLVLLFILAAASTASAIPLVGTNGTTLYKFDSATPGTVETVQINGLVAGDSLVGIEYWAATGQLIGIGNGRLYVLNPVSGAAASVGGQNTTFALSGGTFGTDISPIDNQVHVVSNTNQNIRLSLNDAKVTGTDAPLAESSPVSNIGAIAFTNSFAFASNTTCYGIGSAANPTGAGQLVRIGSVNGASGGSETGAVTKIGSLKILDGAIDQDVGFDIAPNGTAYAALKVAGQLRLYTINLSNGTATLVGTIGSGVATFKGLAAEAGPKPFSNPTQILIPRPITMAEDPTHKAEPYPSAIGVSDMGGVVTKVRLFINNFRHKEPREVPMLLVSPDTTRKMVIWTGVGGGNSNCGLICDNQSNPGSGGANVILDDDAAEFMPKEAPLFSTFYKPTDHDYFITFTGAWGGTEVFPAPAPNGPYAYPGTFGTATFASTFYGTSPNGNWGLYVKDSMGGTATEEDQTTGRIVSGWGLLVWTGPACTLSCSNLTRSAMPGQCGTIVNYPPPNVSGACGTLTYSIPTGSMFPVGTTPVEVTSQFGQKCTFNVTVQDFQPPAITCPADTTVQAASGQNSAVVNYEAMASDNCPNLTVTYEPPSGSSFPIGTTEVRATATDAAQESVSCTFNVTVIEGPPPTPTPSAPATKLANISTRLRVETGDDVLIGGFIITGAEPKRLLVRAIGPSLSFDDRLADPNLQLFNSGGDLIGENNNWKDAANQQEVFDTTIAPSDDLESAVLSTLEPGAYTAVVSGVNGGTGVGLVEAYDLDLNANAKLANIATRGLVQTGDNVMIGGFIVVGPAPQKLVVRAIGSSLSVENKLSDPLLELYDANGDLVAANNDWRTDQEAEIAATGIPPIDDLESAVLTTVPPAAYTAIVRGANDATGVGLVEVYAIE